LLWPDVVEKFHRLVGPLGNTAGQRKVVDAVEQLETTSAPELMEALRAVRGS
jgi:hypothetical protein